MQYRKFGNIDWNVSALGYGCMRLPIAPESGGKIDEPEAIREIRFAVDHDVNYIDTAYGYHGGQSETLVGKALLDGYRNKVRLATKSPVWEIHAPEDFDRLLSEQLGKLQTDHIDFYLLHALDGARWESTILKHDVLANAEQAIRDGRIGHLGFSFHDGYNAFETILNGYDKWTFCQIQYNYMDTENQAGTKGLQLAAQKGLAVIAMEPLLGGRLATPPGSIRQIFEQEDPDRTPADWALQWLWDQPEITMVLSGMSSMEQVEQNLGSAERSASGTFSASGRKVIERVQQAYKDRIAIPCTKCNYCMPCPSGVDIPRVFEIYNYSQLHDDVRGARNHYKWALKPEQRAASCADCGECEEKCPQKIPIRDWMPKVSATLTETAQA